jgi:oligo-1,6-glucosidase
MQPNNWQSIFHGKAWEYDELTDEWYMHLFVKQQPDLNWDNPEVREALYDIARFWLDKGCDGFRVSRIDSLPLLSEIFSTDASDLAPL